MPTFIIQSRADFSDPILLSHEDEHHLTRVLRVRTGETIFLTNNQGLLAKTTITKTDPLQMQVIEIFSGEPTIPATLCVPIIEKKRLEWTLEKLGELNVKTVQLMITARTQISALSESYWQRLKLIIESAQKQSGRAFPMQLLRPVDLKKIPITNSQTTIYATTQTQSCNQSWLNSTVETVFVGPEGGFSSDEESYFAEQSFTPVTLGTNTLRTETACIVLASLLKFR